MGYETLLIKSENNGICIEEKKGMKKEGLYSDGCIWVRKELSENRKTCILAEELGHHFTTVGNILDQSKIENQKQELKARVWAYNYLCPIENIIFALADGYTETWSMAEYLSVDEAFLIECLSYYKFL